MDYQTRPVFEFMMDWGGESSRAITYDLRETKLGFGMEFFDPTATYTANGWTFQLTLPDAACVAAVNGFFDALTGRLNGFWLPVPFEAMQITAAVDATHFKINKIGLADTWNQRPDNVLYIYAEGQAAQIVTIVAVLDNGDGTETVTVGSAMDPVPAPGMIVRKLHYVRLVDDTERASFIFEGCQVRQVNVIELPLEYTGAETGLRPVFLYHFEAVAPASKDWYYTSFSNAVWLGGNKYIPFQMTHKAVQQTSRGDKDELEIQVKSDPTHPLSLFFPEALGVIMEVDIQSADLSDPDGTAFTLFRGIVRSVEDTGTSLSAKCSTALYLYDRKVPRMLIQPNCNYALFDVNCAVLRANFEMSVILNSSDTSSIAPSVVVQMAFPGIRESQYTAADWFAGGLLESGLGLSYETRTILSSTWSGLASTLTLTLNAPLLKANNGDWLQITPGCDGLGSTCRNKFNNFARFGGFPAVPQRNLSLEAFENLPVNQGGKK